MTATIVMIDHATESIISRIKHTRELLRAASGSDALPAIADQLAVELADLRAQDEELYEQAKASEQGKAQQ